MPACACVCVRVRACRETHRVLSVCPSPMLKELCAHCCPACLGGQVQGRVLALQTGRRQGPCQHARTYIHMHTRNSHAPPFPSWRPGARACSGPADGKAGGQSAGRMSARTHADTYTRIHATHTHTAFGVQSKVKVSMSSSSPPTWEAQAISTHTSTSFLMALSTASRNASPPISNPSPFSDPRRQGGVN